MMETYYQSRMEGYYADEVFIKTILDGWKKKGSMREKEN